MLAKPSTWGAVWTWPCCLPQKHRSCEVVLAFERDCCCRPYHLLRCQQCRPVCGLASVPADRWAWEGAWQSPALRGRESPQAPWRQGTVAHLFPYLRLPNREREGNNLLIGKMASFVLTGGSHPQCPGDPAQAAGPILSRCWEVWWLPDYLWALRSAGRQQPVSVLLGSMALQQRLALLGGQKTQPCGVGISGHDRSSPQLFSGPRHQPVHRRLWCRSVLQLLLRTPRLLAPSHFLPHRLAGVTPLLQGHFEQQSPLS